MLYQGNGNFIYMSQHLTKNNRLVSLEKLDSKELYNIIITMLYKILSSTLLCSFCKNSEERPMYFFQ